MVRNIAGCLLKVGLGEVEEDWLQHVLDARDRSVAAPTAQPEGLYFVRARYPAEYALPEAPPAFPRGVDLS